MTSFLKRRGTRFPLLFITLLAMLLFVFIANIAIGSVHISFGEVGRILLPHWGGDSTYETIVWKIRLPRALATVFGGAALAVSGLLFQVLFRNPLAGPFVLGVSAGASLAVALLMLAGVTLGFTASHPLSLFLAAFLGSMGAMALVLSFAPRVKNIVTLLLIGLMIGYLCSAITSALIAFAEKERVHGFVLWGMGSFSGFRWEDVLLLGVGGGLFLFGAFLASKPLNAFLLGEEYARSMGVNIRFLRIAIVLIASLLAAVVTAFAGPVAFIGLAVPHMARLSFRTSDNWFLIPGVIFLGAVVTSLCDLGARTIFSPVELPISAVTSFFGAPDRYRTPIARENGAMSMVKTEKLTVGYGRKIVVDDINLEALRGQVIALLGPNGSGKSTMIKTLAGLLAPLGGVVYLKGERLEQLSPGQVAKSLGVVLTEPISPGLMTAFDVAAIGRHPYTGFFGRLSHRDEQIVWEALQLVDAQDLGHRYFSELSDGEKQKVLLARALAQEPEVIILDEPTSHLDIRYRFEVMEILRGLAREKGVTVLLSSHEVDLILKTCSIAIPIKDGEIWDYGAPEEILEGERIAQLYDIKGAYFASQLGGTELRSKSRSFIYVLAGAGSGVHLFRALAKQGFGVLTGVLPQNDIDFYVAQAIGATIIAEKPYQEISQESYEQALKLLGKAQQVIDAGFPIGALNRRNVDLIRHCLGQEKIVCTLRSRKDAEELFDSPAQNLIYCQGVASILETLDATDNH